MRSRHPVVELGYARLADDLVILIDAHPRHDWLMAAVEKRLREELAELQVDLYFIEPLAKFIERGEFSLCSRGGGAGAQAGAGLSCVTRSI